MTIPSVLSTALEHQQENRNCSVQMLKDLVRIPSISFPGFDPEPVKRCAHAVASLLSDCGLKDVELIDAGTGYPSVFGQWTERPDSPTLLLYAHYDVQPAGREGLWISPPFEPVERNGRLYGRGASDDKAGAVLYAVAVRSFLRTAGKLPINVKVLIEGEEEVGSSNLGTILKNNIDRLSADAVVIADSENFDTGLPALTASLRGIVTVQVEVRSLGASVHSGTWGGPLPDPVQALAKMIASLTDADGVIAVPGMLDEVRPLSPAEKAALDALPFDEGVYRGQVKLLDGIAATGGTGSVYEKMWRRPSIAINAIEASSRKQAANIINDAAWARIGVRIVPDMNPGRTLDLLSAHLRAHAPWGVQVAITPETPSPWWLTDTKGPYFEAALHALGQGYGAKPVITGAGGSIPFVQTITDALNGAPALLFGVGDPYTAAHSENESVPIDDWHKACRSLMCLFAELGRAAG